jgi:hypothetical protein
MLGAMTSTAVFGLDGLDISRYQTPEEAVAEVEGQDVVEMDWIGADGTVYRPTAGTPDWGPATLHPTEERRLDELVCRLRDMANSLGLELPTDLPQDPESIWAAVMERTPQRRADGLGSWFRRRKSRP